MKLWCRYLLRHLLATFFFFLFCCLAIYLILDLSIHGVRFFSKETTSLSAIAYFYLCTFSLYLPYFLPITYLLASLKVLLDLNAHQELVALQLAGLSKKTLLIPFFAFAGGLSLLLYANNQWMIPHAHQTAATFRTEHSQKKSHPKRDHVYHLALDDHSELIYQRFDEANNELFDVFWVRTPHDIWYMKYLQIALQEGRYVDHLQRNNLGIFEKTESFAHFTFPQIHWDRNTALERFIPFEERPLSTLFIQACTTQTAHPHLLTHLHYKMALPLLPLFILIGISPVALRFGRARPTFLIVAISLFACIGFMVLLDGMVILGENQVFPAALSMWGPIALFGLMMGLPFARI